ncbi:AAA family ATPase, partial [Pseudomonadota bacterium]
MNDTILEIQQALTAGYPIIYLHTDEEDRAHRFLSQIARKRSLEFPLLTWTCTRGLQPPLEPGPSDDRDAVEVINHLADKTPSGYYLMKDLSELMETSTLVRAIKDAYYALRSNPNLTIFILASELVIPASLEKHLIVIDIGPPGIDELTEMVKDYAQQARKVKLPADLLVDICHSLHGMTLSEAQHIMRRALSVDKLTPRKIIEDIREAKKSMTAHARFLEYVPQQKEIGDVAGLDYLKQWIVQRRDVFSHQSMESGLPIPRGILIMGISGCGKSLSAKVVASTWNVPLFRLDMNLVFSDIYGNPEATFYRALKTIETVAPAVLWIDEIENG